ncbi:MAG: response regulator transcription factor, partial [Verrucomicrobia bacterium]|nr:response regulator transcription factor [Verrucomicrobiota bacterium]
MPRETKGMSLARSKRKRRRIYLLDDHPMVRYGMTELINGESDLIVCGEAANTYDAIDDLPKAKPDLVLVDITLQGKSGLEFIKETQRLQTGLDTLVVSMHDEGFYA